MKLAVVQIALGIMIIIFGSLGMGAMFSVKFGYLSPTSGEEIEAIRPEALEVARGATLVVIPVGLGVIGCGIAQFKKAKSK